MDYQYIRNSLHSQLFCLVKSVADFTLKSSSGQDFKAELERKKERMREREKERKKKERENRRRAAELSLQNKGPSMI